jgi:hypothetical protein
MSSKSLLKAMMPAKWKGRLREQLVAMSVTRLHGPASLQLSSNEAVVTCVVRNGEYYIESFIRHYSRMGFRHIFFLDNGSTDQTLAIARSYDNVSILRSTLPISSHQRLFKKYLAQRAGRGGWCLDADIDEFFEYPHSNIVDLKDLLNYLNQHRYTALVTQMLDMFSDRPMSHLASEQKEDIRRDYPYYDLANITKTDYRTADLVAKYGCGNVLSNRETALCWGGIRRTLYGNDCLLTKHSLFMPWEGVGLFPHVHFVSNARLADLSGVLLHYKLTSNAMAIAIQNREHFKENSKTYGAFIEVMKNGSEREIRSKTAEKLRSVVDLTERNFIVMSPVYEGYAMDRAMSKLQVSETKKREAEWPVSRA